MRQMALEIRPAVSADVLEIAHVHLQVFEGYFLSKLGPAFLQHYYGTFLAQSRSRVVVAADGGRVVGFAAATSSVEELYTHLYRRHFMEVARIVAGRCVTDPQVRRDVVRRLRHIAYALAALLKHDAIVRPPTPFHPSAAKARLLAVGLLNEYRGCGAAASLVEALCEAMRRAGSPQLGLSVRVDNTRAIAFYEKTGWTREHSTSFAIYFVRGP